MKQSFWFLNFTLLILFIFILLFALFSKIKIPTRQSIEPYLVMTTEVKDQEKIDTNIIYKNDLFNTYLPQVQHEVKEIIESMPPAPAYVAAHVPEAMPPHFFEPLPITVTGIIIFEDETKNIAIIMDNKTQQQVNYKVGDEIEDAQLIRILKNKIILVRSNGQQETLYLRSEDAKIDNPSEKINMENIIKKINNELYYIDPTNFVKHIRNLGELFEIFDLSTAYKEGISIGTIIRKIEQDSIPVHMGFQPGDIILKINDISTDKTDNQIEIYNNIISKKQNDNITVELLRNNNNLKINYKLQKLLESPKKLPATEGKLQIEKIENNKIENEKIKILKEKYKFAPTIEEIILKEKQNLFKKEKLI